MTESAKLVGKTMAMGDGGFVFSGTVLWFKKSMLESMNVPSRYYLPT